MKIFIIVVVLFVAFLLLGALTGPKQTDDREKMCKQWMEDSAPGSERRMTREMCNRLGVKL